MMKKSFFVAMAACLCLSAFGENRVEGHRFNGSDATEVEGINFVDQQNDRAEASVKIMSAGKKGGAVSVSVKRNPTCATFSLECLPSEIAGMIPNDDVLVSFIRNKKAPVYHADLKKTKLVDLGFAFNQATDYTFFVVPYDKDGKAGKVSKTNFHAPAQPVLGTPKVNCEIVSVGTDSVVVRFTPNKDVAGYGLCVFTAGTMMSEVDKHGPTMGFKTAADMIKRFSGKDYTDQYTKTWKDLVPNTEYDFCVQMWDKNGMYLDVVKATAKTAVLGGPGLATVAIDIMDFGGSAETGHFQTVHYTPNDQASLHRDLIITEEAFNKADMGDEGVIKMLKTDAPNDPFWNQYGVDKAQWNATPNTAYIACSIARNANGEWGPLQKVRFVTPEAAAK